MHDAKVYGSKWYNTSEIFQDDWFGSTIGTKETDYQVNATLILNCIYLFPQLEDFALSQGCDRPLCGC